MTILMWLMLSAVLLTPLGLLLARKNWAFLPGIVYALAVWGFLVIGLPFLKSPYSGDWILSYGIVVAIAAFPVWMLLLIPVSPRQKNPVVVPPRPGDVLLFFMLWLGCILGVIAYNLYIGPTPLLSLLSENGFARLGHGSALMEIRKAATYTGSFGRFKLLFYVMPPLIALFGHILYRQKRIGLVLNSASVILAMLLTIQFLHKGTLVFFVTKLFLLEMYLTGVSVRRIAKLGIIAFVLIIGMYFFYAGYVNQQLMINMLRRIFVAYVEILEFTLAVWPEQNEYFWGVTFPNPRGIFPYDPVNLAGEVFAVLRGGTGNAPVPSIGEGYVNFGFMGVIVVTGFIALWLMFLVTMFRIARRNAMWLAIWITLAFEVNAFGRTSYFGGVDLRSLALMTLIVMLVLTVREFINTVSKRQKRYAVS